MDMNLSDLEKLQINNSVRESTLSGLKNPPKIKRVKMTPEFFNTQPTAWQYIDSLLNINKK